jgi:hypothetical protein
MTYLVITITLVLLFAARSQHRRELAAAEARRQRLLSAWRGEVATVHAQACEARAELVQRHERELKALRDALACYRPKPKPPKRPRLDRHMMSIVAQLVAEGRTTDEITAATGLSEYQVYYTCRSRRIDFPAESAPAKTAFERMKQILQNS